MGDIARHRDIFLNTRDAVPSDLLSRCRLSQDDLTFLELGNYFTDVSQFRDPVFYLFAKQTVWREKVLPGAEKSNELKAAKGVIQALAIGAAAALAATLNEEKKAFALAPVAVSALVGGLNNQINDWAAAAMNVDDWLDRMLGTPIEKLDKNGKRRPEDYGFVGRFFQHFIEGVTHLLFADDVASPPKGSWSQIRRIPASRVSAVFERAFTQYFPHEHTDQPPYVWDASQRPGKPMYEPPRKLGAPRGIMNVVHEHYIGYLAEGLTKLENDWRSIKKEDGHARQMWLLDLGKLLHGVEDWYFHSNVVDLIRLHAHKPDEVAEADREAFVKRVIRQELSSEPEYTKTGANKKRLERFFYRRLRTPVYSAGTRENTGGVASKRTSTLNWDHAYPAFPSTLDTAHTLLGALEGIEAKFHPTGAGDLSLSKLFEGAPWLDCVMKKFHDAGPEWSRIYHDKAAARRVTLNPNGMPSVRSADDIPRIQAWTIDVLRELVPLVLTLLHQRERQRLVADIAPMDMPLDNQAPLPRSPSTEPKEEKEQLARHGAALKPTRDRHGNVEHNYARAARYFKECGSLNEAGRQAIVAAFDVDIESEKKKVNSDTPGAGGFLIQFAVKLQKQIDKAEAVTEERDRDDPFASIATDNGSDNEIIGSHSLMSKDTKSSSPFFEDARVMGSVASLACLHLLLDEVSAPGQDRLDWQRILRFFIRFPLKAGGWERQAMALFVANGRATIPKFADIPELSELKKLRLPAAQAEAIGTGDRAAKLRQMYVDLEKKLTRYRYP